MITLTILATALIMTSIIIAALNIGKANNQQHEDDEKDKEDF